jgi:hypothetical protein
VTDIARSRTAMTGLWYALAVGPAAWAAHITGQAAFVRYACNDPEWHWVLHALTVATAVPTIVGLLICRSLLARSPDPEEAGSPAGRTRFLALLAAFTAAISLALILLEGSYVLFISDCA